MFFRSTHLILKLCNQILNRSREITTGMNFELGSQWIFPAISVHGTAVPLRFRIKMCSNFKQVLINHEWQNLKSREIANTLGKARQISKNQCFQKEDGFQSLATKLQLKVLETKNYHDLRDVVTQKSDFFQISKKIADFNGVKLWNKGFF